MAAGFSYAQAARGRQASAQSTTENGETPLESSKEWAEDVEASVKTKDTIAEPAETSKPIEARSSTVERTKLESKAPSHSSGVSSPDLAASATSHDDVSSSTQNGSSLSSWEAKSQSSDTVVASEPAWIAERKERQNVQKSDQPTKGSNTTIMPEQKPITLHDAPPPAVNPWAKRAEEAKAKVVPQSLPKPVSIPVNTIRTQLKENQEPRADTHKNTSKIDSIPKETVRTRKPAQPPSVKDEASWPTPETSQETERKPSTQEDKADDEDTKPRKKQEWKPVPVVPNIIWETPGVRERNTRSAPNGDRTARGGASTRARGGSRGGAIANTSRDTTEAVESTKVEKERESRSPASARKSINGVKETVNGDDTVEKEVTHTKDETPPQIDTTLGAVEARKEYTKDWPATRGARRGGRGRGGNREVVNGHYPYTNGHIDFPGQYNTFVPRGGHQYSGYGHGRAGRTTQGRTQSFPVEALNTRFANQYIQQPLYPVQAFQSPVSDYGAYAMPITPVQGQMDYLIGTVINQLDYYFSLDNLLKDNFLRKNMDSQGFVYLEVIAAFNRVQQLTNDIEILKMACANSEIVEICIGEDGKERLRKISDWQHWVLPVEERFPAVQHAGPQQIENIGRAISAYYAQMSMRHHMSIPFIPQGRPGDRKSYDFSYNVPHQMSPQAMFTPEYSPQEHSKDDARGHDAKDTAQENGVQREDNDTFPDHKIEQLTVCVQISKAGAPHINGTSRSFSNGSIDTKKDLNGAAVLEGSNDISIESSKPGTGNAQDLSVFWVKDEDTPQDKIPHGLTPEPYFQLRAKALEQRGHAATGNCPYDMDVLYQFWSHFLIRNFNNNMYTEFVHLANEDANERQCRIGQGNLMKYYFQAVHSANSVPLRVARDYLNLAKADASDEDSTVFKTLNKAWRSGALNIYNRKRLLDVMDADMKQLLEG